ncbi:carboxylating nicotinate-nucleotide diphosphorylase [Roseinatronobacter bogoriensis]|uniref:Probable nicotinate-nucleotide pyrophosphorylase [carboxylating] n=1 Tax=Roseinatronobacter bogoriensis subsp. barguzinensis TaxID=441209 RepID=A0A2K8KCM7_9RHOB|nr:MULTISPECIES: carboxylating nicotinate-nucleotide diphosphorylase [Rhodobaca]ATX67199.1 nicotinate-nucleotide diphosphorylase (carboxylating) [Rhodobaca barguzinensis]MBB4206737.1 nicotinate-nucleotide pyrophosphorylase (carboxylating) [Rhodobaca bogoriensis DSM 18756]TDW41481.1 nicotinate-nucleotide pyrophosphorylase [carboxylating] [Rhodobaca barguzinensis]TDY74341.1 nicotinate-nucleotide pyrophosphorylase [carboxylating] [Rhodobaca bogoriensis DSM 18756]
MTHSPLPELLVEPLVRAALVEDLGPSGDVTSAAVIPHDLRYSATLNARQDGVISGGQLAELAFRLVDPSLVVKVHRPDGSTVRAGDAVMTIEGAALSILAAERVALNFMGRLSGVATLTARFVAKAQGTDARITCTRKTTPGLRLVEKQAVLHGGGAAHRFGLSDAILIKDNHIAAAGGIAPALRAARTSASHMRRIEIEVDTLAQLDEVLETGGADVVLLDNMTTADLTAAVQRVAEQLVTEASGTMRLDRIAEVAATGVDFISVGALTHSAPVLDLGLDF